MVGGDVDDFPEVVHVATKQHKTSNSSSGLLRVSDEGDGDQQHHRMKKSNSTGTSSSGGKKNFLDGFRHTLRPRTRSDDFTDDKGQFRPDGLATIMANVKTESEQEKNPAVTASKPPNGSGLIRRWSESAPNKNNNNHAAEPAAVNDPMANVLAPGANVKVRRLQAVP